jgi:hypothetical protein
MVLLLLLLLLLLPMATLACNMFLTVIACHQAGPGEVHQVQPLRDNV